MNVQPVVVIPAWVWLVVTFWKPLLVAFVVVLALLFLLLPIGTRMARESAARYDAAVPTLAIPEVWRERP